MKDRTESLVGIDIEKSHSVPVSPQSNPVERELAVDYGLEFATNQVFTNRDELIQWVREMGKKSGFVLIVSKFDSGGLYNKGRIWFGCERGGQPRFKTLKDDKCHKGSKKCGCPFRLKGQQISSGSPEFALSVLCGLHNHPAAEYLEGHSYAGRLSESEAQVVMEMSKCHVKAKDILTSLKQRDPMNVSTMKTIYHARHKFKVNEQGGRTQMQQLLLKIKESKYIEWHRSNHETDAVTDLFWAHPTGVDLLRAFPGVLIIDCTYKTNRYKYPLLEIVGVTSTNMSFGVAFAFLERECETNYAWALDKLRGLFPHDEFPNVIVTDRDLSLVNAVKQIFPVSRHLLCRWHINKNVLTNCKKFLEKQAEWEKFFSLWKLIMVSDTLEEYNSYVSKITNEFRSRPDAVDYIVKTWLDPHKEKFVAYWTNMCQHRDNLTSNRAESAHARLKRQLRTSQGDFEICWRNIHTLLELQHTEIKASFEKSLTVVKRCFMLPELKELRGNVSIHALDIILSQIQRIDSVGVNPAECGCIIRQTHNLPCAHKIALLRRDTRPIPLESIDLHWRKLDLAPTPKGPVQAVWYQKDVQVFIQNFINSDNEERTRKLRKLREISNPVSSSLADPVPRVTRQRSQLKRKLDISTRRDPCAFELDYMPPTIGVSSQPRKLLPKKGRPRKIPKYEGRVSLKLLDDPASGTESQLLPLEEVSLIATPGSQPPSKSHNIYADSLPCFMRPYIVDVGDVKANENCGFRVIAHSLGMGEDKWPQIRRDLLQELDAHFDSYTRILGNMDRALDLRKILDYFRDCPRSDYWMTMPDMGHLIASRFNLVLFFISQTQCLTFLPLRSPPPAGGSQRTEVTMAFVAGCHFVPVKLCQQHPVPNIALNWHRHRDAVAQG